MASTVPGVTLFNPEDHYWFIGNDRTQVYSSKRAIFVPVADVQYVTWTTGNVLTSIVGTVAEIWPVLVMFAPVAAAANPTSFDLLKEKALNDIAAASVVAIISKALFNHENRIRALEGKVALTPAQFRAGIKALL